MKDIFKKGLGALGLEITDDSPSPAPKTEKAQAAIAPAPQTYQQPVYPQPAAYPQPQSGGGYNPPPPPPNQGEVYQKMKIYFRSLMDKNNVPGPDLKEVMDSVINLMAIIPDERMRYNAAFQSLQNMGLTMEKIDNSAQIYNTLLEKDKSEFGGELQKKRETEITSRQNNVASLTKQIAEWSKKIQDAQQTITTLNAEAYQQDQDIRLKEQAYNYEFDNMKNLLQETVTKLKQYIANNG